MCAVHCAQLLHIILHRTDLLIFPLALYRSAGFLIYMVGTDHQRSPGKSFELLKLYIFYSSCPINVRRTIMAKVLKIKEKVRNINSMKMIGTTK